MRKLTAVDTDSVCVNIWHTNWGIPCIQGDSNFYSKPKIFQIIHETLGLGHVF